MVWKHDTTETRSLEIKCYTYFSDKSEQLRSVLRNKPLIHKNFNVKNLDREVRNLHRSYLRRSKKQELMYHANVSETLHDKNHLRHCDLLVPPLELLSHYIRNGSQEFRELGIQIKFFQTTEWYLVQFQSDGNSKAFYFTFMQNTQYSPM